MDRKEFLEKLGIGAAFALTATCLGGCAKDTSPEPKDIDISINLSEDKYSALHNLGGYVIQDEIVIARSIVSSEGYLAASITCSHESLQQIIYNANNGEWFCTAHGARYDIEGSGLNPVGNGGLVVYKTTLEGNTLRIFN